MSWGRPSARRAGESNTHPPARPHLVGDEHLLERHDVGVRQQAVVDNLVGGGGGEGVRHRTSSSSSGVGRRATPAPPAALPRPSHLALYIFLVEPRPQLYKLDRHLLAGHLVSRVLHPAKRACKHPTGGGGGGGGGVCEAPPPTHTPHAGAPPPRAPAPSDSAHPCPGRGSSHTCASGGGGGGAQRAGALVPAKQRGAAVDTWHRGALPSPPLLAPAPPAVSAPHTPSHEIAGQGLYVRHRPGGGAC